MQQIAEWLEKLGMSEYASRFAENDIEIDLLNELTDEDFDRLGVSEGVLKRSRGRARASGEDRGRRRGIPSFGEARPSSRRHHTASRGAAGLMSRFVRTPERHRGGSIPSPPNDLFAASNFRVLAALI